VREKSRGTEIRATVGWILSFERTEFGTGIKDAVPIPKDPSHTPAARRSCNLTNTVASEI